MGEEPDASVPPPRAGEGNREAVEGALDRHLLSGSARPIAMALSGGGDSLALTLFADAWARAHDRALVILTVDHRLQAASPAWTEACAATARRLGRPFQVLAWEDEKPRSGLPAAARAARHRLLAEAARAAGARVILMGHTADDVAEAAAMRGAGGRVPDPREWSPSPAWPEGRGLFLLRPLLDVRRADLRAWLRNRGEAWIDDPANADLRYARGRARAQAPAPAARGEPPPLTLAARAVERAGVITLARADLRAAARDDAQRFMALAAVCAGGGARLPPSVRVARLVEAATGPDPFTGTLAGARIEADVHEIRTFREAGEAARGGLEALHPPGVWDGRFAFADGPEVRRLAGLARRLPRIEQAALRALPPAARGALPARMEADGAVTCPALTGTPSLVGERLRAAAGLVQREPA